MVEYALLLGNIGFQNKDWDEDKGDIRQTPFRNPIIQTTDARSGKKDSVENPRLLWPVIETAQYRIRTDIAEQSGRKAKQTSFHLLIIDKQNVRS